jgi:2-keto-4-pentenoate hydratase/2-oxohepta-3-ene-1,7-dioic acid hydratase in catechol pathway
MDHVFGYTSSTTSAPATCRCGTSSGTSGKSFDTFCPMGPWITTADELDGRATRVRGWVNGELRQDAPDEGHDLRHPDADRDLLARHHALPGDVIATGTMAGVGMGFKPPKWLGAGDVVKIEIDGIGAIENRFE